MKDHISIVIPTWNGLALLKRFLPSVIAAANLYAEQSGCKVEIVVVDDGSTDETIAWLDSLKKDSGFRIQDSAIASQPNAAFGLPPGGLRWLQNEKNMGFSATCNRGIAAALYPLVFLLNNDVEIADDAIAPLVENFADARVFAAHCRVFELESNREVGTGKVGSFARGFIRVHQSYATRADEGERSREPLFSMFAGGGSAMFDREKFLQTGGFDCLLSPFYWEDVELSYRAWKRGYTVLYEPRSVARHRVSSTIGKLNQRRVRLIEQRNRLIYHWIHLHDSFWLTSHIYWVIFLALTAPLRFNPMFILSFIEAVKRFPAIRQRRREEKQKAQRTDRELFAVFSALSRRDDLQVYDKIKDA